jgi:NitT/TauT family transport system substrate-binding protein
MGKLGMKLDDVNLITVANPQSKEQAVLNKQADALLGYFMDQGPSRQLQTGVKMGWTRLYDMAGVTTLSSAIIANNNWLKEAKNQDQLRRFLRASQRGWQYAFDHRDEAADIFRKSAPVFTQEIAKLEVDGTMTIIRTERTKGKPIAWSDAGDWKDSQDLLAKFAKLSAQPDVNVYFTNDYLSQAPYLPRK